MERETGTQNRLKAARLAKQKRTTLRGLALHFNPSLVKTEPGAAGQPPKLVVDEAAVDIESITSPIKLSQTDSKSTITGDYLIITDGADSQFAKNLDMGSLSFNYDQTSYMFNTYYQHLSKGAFQIFSKKGIFAIPVSYTNLKLPTSDLV